MFWNLVGIIAATLTMFGFVPQVIKMARIKSAKDVSFLTLCQLSLGVSFWIAYGVHIRDPIVITANIITLLTLTLALILYIKYN